MTEEGYLDHSPKFLLIRRKIMLRAIANTILDIRMQTMNMTDQQAMDLMLNDTFQTQAEAEGKLQRAKLSSTQLPTYFLGVAAVVGAAQEVSGREGQQLHAGGVPQQGARPGSVALGVPGEDHSALIAVAKCRREKRCRVLVNVSVRGGQLSVHGGKNICSSARPLPVGDAKATVGTDLVHVNVPEGQRFSRFAHFGFFSRSDEIRRPLAGQQRGTVFIHH